MSPGSLIRGFVLSLSLSRHRSIVPQAEKTSGIAARNAPPARSTGLRQALSQLVSLEGRKDGPTHVGKHAFCITGHGSRRERSGKRRA
jgi:hypothetical protein